MIVSTKALRLLRESLGELMREMPSHDPEFRAVAREWSGVNLLLLRDD